MALTPDATPQTRSSEGGAFLSRVAAGLGSALLRQSAAQDEDEPQHEDKEERQTPLDLPSAASQHSDIDALEWWRSDSEDDGFDHLEYDPYLDSDGWFSDEDILEQSCPVFDTERSGSQRIYGRQEEFISPLIYSTRQELGIGHLAKVLTGAEDDRIRQRGHDRLSVFGIVGAEEAALLQPLARALQARGALIANAHGGLALGGDARAILSGGETVEIVVPPKRTSRRSERGAANPVGDPLFEALRVLRRDLAQEAGVPPYVIFHDSTLRAMAEALPRSLTELGALPGIGAKKLEAYGAPFLKELQSQ